MTKLRVNACRIGAVSMCAAREYGSARLRLAGERANAQLTT